MSDWSQGQQRHGSETRATRPIQVLTMTVAVVFLLCALMASAQTNSSKLTFEVSFPSSVEKGALDGRVLLAISKQEKPEPRFAILEEEAKSQQLFGVDVNGLAPGASAVIDSTTLGYPLRSLDQLPAGDYYVQAVLNRYETFHRADGHVVKLPPEMGEGQQWNRKPGNLFSKPQKMHLDPSGGAVRIALTEKIPPIEPPKDTAYVKHLRIQSKLLSDFWGRPMYLGAIVVLPEGYEQHPEAHYPLLIEQGHFPADFSRFRTEMPAVKPGESEGERTRAAFGYELYQDWSSGRMPKMLLLLIQHANPYYDDSYAVNSANVGPYGDAITKELIPEVERRFRGIGQPWARALYGGSTGGWETLAEQIFYPDYFNGAWGFCPDPVDFHAYQAVNIYDDKNAYWHQGPFGRVPTAEMRDSKGDLLAVMEPAVRREEVIGTRGRSAEQFAIWQAVFSPVGEDGYPKPIWNFESGAIDPQVATYWRDHYDLVHIMERDWATLGPKLANKMHIAVGDMDTWYLNNGVHRMQDFLDSHANAYKVADFDYGPGQPHCYTGGPNLKPQERNGRLLQRIMPQVAEHMVQSAPKGADMSWRY